MGHFHHLTLNDICQHRVTMFVFTIRVNVVNIKTIAQLMVGKVAEL